MNRFCRNGAIACAVLVFSLPTFDFFVHAFDTDAASLSGLEGVSVLVETSGAEIKEQGLTVDLLRTDVELRLQIAGIKVLSKQEFSKSRGRPLLYLSVEMSRLDVTRSYACFLHIALRQNVYLKRDPKVRGIVAATWSKTMTAVVLDSEDLRAKVKDLASDFVNAYTSVSPKKQIDTGIRG